MGQGEDMEAESTASARKKAEKSMKNGEKIFDRAFDGFGKTMSANLETQQEFLRMWTDLWSRAGIPCEGKASESMRWPQEGWSNTLNEVLERRRAVMETQYKGVMQTLEAAMEVAQSTSPQEFRDKSERFYRTSLSAAQASSEAQLEEMQTAFKKCMELSSIDLTK